MQAEAQDSSGSGSRGTARATPPCAACRSRCGAGPVTNTTSSGEPPFGDATLEVAQHGFALQRLAGLDDDQQQRSLLPFRMRDADDRGLGDQRVAHGRVLQGDGGDPFAAGLDHVLGAVGDLHVAIRSRSSPRRRYRNSPRRRGSDRLRRGNRRAATHGPRIFRWPAAWPSCGRRRPASSVSLRLTPNTARPCFACTSRRCSSGSARCLGSRLQTVPTGEVSVMPQACTHEGAEIAFERLDHRPRRRGAADHDATQRQFRRSASGPRPRRAATASSRPWARPARA